MHAQVVAIDVGCDRHAFETADEELVDFLVVELVQDLSSEREVLSHSTRLVISAQHNHVLGVSELEAEKENADFEREDTSVNVISKEK